MTILIGLLAVALLSIVIIQIGKISEMAGALRGEKDIEERSNVWNSRLILAFMILFLVGVIYITVKYKNYMLGYGPHESASAHGTRLDQLFTITLFITGLVFFITHILLFWFAYKYRGKKGRAALYMPHDNKLELIWTIVPAFVMTILVVFGLNAWNQVMSDVGPDEDYLEIEATGMQFAWIIRYPGADGKLGKRYYKNISGTNPLGQIWEDEANIDDFQPSDIVLPVNKKVRVKITSRDVLHNFYLPHFRLKMDAVPGMPTYFVFTPTKTTEEYRRELSRYEEYQRPSDPDDPTSDPLWQKFEYELACAELCGTGHFSMRKIVKIVSEEEYNEWLATQQSHYMQLIRNSDEDPFKGKLLGSEIEERAVEFGQEIQSAIESESKDDDILVLKHLFYETGSDNLDEQSRYELQNVMDALNKYPNLKVELAGHTDNTGSADGNLNLSKSRATAAMNYLIEKGMDRSRLTSKGYGQTQPIADNDTEEGRQMNRRTELRIISK
jgi:cytochrome c oxidase subunit 2